MTMTEEERATLTLARNLDRNNSLSEVGKEWLRMLEQKAARETAGSPQQAAMRALLSQEVERVGQAGRLATYHHDLGVLFSEEVAIAAMGKALEEAAKVVDQCNHEGPYNAIGAASRIRALIP